MFKMKIRSRLALMGMFIISTLFSTGLLSAPSRMPAKIIFDTDMGNDVDDVLALALIHSLQNRGLCDLRAITFTNPDTRAVPYTHMLNRFYGRPDIPLGFTPDAPFAYETKYMQLLEKKDSRGEMLYADSFRAGDAWDSVKLLRKTLAESADGEITIIQVGFSTNLVRLMKTSGDEYSPLNGMDLIKKKVKLLSVMGGIFPDNLKRKGEFNIVHDIPSAIYLTQHWPTPIIWVGLGLGNKIRFDARCIDDFLYTEKHPVRESYEMYDKMPYERPLWDLLSVFYVIYPDHGYFTLSEAGTVSVNASGQTLFKEGRGSRDRYLDASPEQAIRLREVLSKLVSEPPKALPAGNR